MPTIVNPHRGRPDDAPFPDLRHTGSSAGSSPAVLLRIRTAAQRSGLTRALAEGADPTMRPELALRAAQLTSRRSRDILARTLRRTVAEAYRPAMTRSRVVIIRRDAVLEAEGEIVAMIARLAGSGPLRAKGVAMVERMITNDDASPLYNPGEPGALRRLIGVATAAMEPGAAQSHEFPIAA